MHHRETVTLVLAIMLCGAGCQKKSGAPPGEEKAQAPADTSAVALPPLSGTWTIISHHTSEASAMSESEADTWLGRTLRLSATGVVSGDVSCSHPSYTTLTMDHDDLLGMDVGYPSGVLLRLAPVETLTLVNVSCDDGPLQAPGRLIIEIDADHIFAPWEGVFFELARETQ